MRDHLMGYPPAVEPIDTDPDWEEAYPLGVPNRVIKECAVCMDMLCATVTAETARVRQFETVPHPNPDGSVTHHPRWFVYGGNAFWRQLAAP